MGALIRTRRHTVKRVTYEHQPAAVGTDEAITIDTIKKGTRVLSVTRLVEIPSATSTTSTFKLGVTGTDNGFMAVTVVTVDTYAAGDIQDGGAGSLFASTGGYLATADIALVSTYTKNTQGAVNPKIKWIVATVNDLAS